MLVCCLMPFSAYGLSFDTVAIENIDTHGAMIRWVTNAPANGTIYYGNSTAEATQVTITLDNQKNHWTPIYTLREGEDYVFRITARDTAGVMRQSDWHMFRTLGVPAPKITNVDFVEITREGGRAVWRSNIPVRGTFECGYDTTYGFRTLEKKFNKAHEVTIKRFNPRRRVLYRILAEDARGLRAPQWRGEFMTAEHNIAVGSKVTGTFVRNPEPSYVKDTPPIIERVTDGGMSYFENMATSGDPDSDTQWVEIDLGKIHDASEILTYWRALAYPKKFSLRISLNRENWYDLGDTFDASTGKTFRSATGDPLWEHEALLGNRILRYIRLEVPKGAPYYKRFDGYKFVQLFELKVYPVEEIKR